MMRVTEEDVYLALGLPKGLVQVIKAQNQSDGNIEFQTLVNSWKEQWPYRDTPPNCGELM